MRLKNKFNNTLASEGMGEATSFKIKADGQIFDMFSSLLYSNKPRAILRELGCNAYDSHVLNGNPDKPFKVKLPTQWDPTLVIQDFGTGLSREDMLDLYSTYFESTKRDSNNYTGAFGIGSKSPFSYTDQYTVISVHAGRKGTYVASLTDEGTPTITLLNEEETTEPSGLSVHVPVEAKDLKTFARESEGVFKYFKTVPDISGADVVVETPTYSQRTDHWGLQEDTNRKTMVLSTNRYVPNFAPRTTTGTGITLVQGNISFPLDVSAVTNSKYDLGEIDRQFKLDLFFEIGDLNVALNRESLHYNNKTQKMIDIRLSSFVAQLKEALETQSKKIKTLWEAYRFLENNQETVNKLSSIEPGFKLTTNPIFDDIATRKYGSHSIKFSGGAYATISILNVDLDTLSSFQSPKYETFTREFGRFERSSVFSTFVIKGIDTDKLPIVMHTTQVGDSTKKVRALKYYLEQKGFIKNAEILQGVKRSGSVLLNSPKIWVIKGDKALANTLLARIEPTLQITVDIDELPNPPKTASTSTKRKVTEFYSFGGYEKRSRYSWSSRSRTGSGSMQWKPLEIKDTSTPRVFVPISSWQPMRGTEQCTKSNFEFVVSMAISAGVISKQSEVVGIPATFKDNIVDLEKGGWQNLFDLTIKYYCDTLSTYSQADVAFCNSATASGRIEGLSRRLVITLGKGALTKPQHVALLKEYKLALGIEGIGASMENITKLAELLSFKDKVPLDLDKSDDVRLRNMEGDGEALLDGYPILKHLHKYDLDEDPDAIQDVIWYLNNK